MISPSSYQPVCSSPHESRKSAAAAAAASSVNRRGAVTVGEEDEGGEGEEPGDVEVEPVRQHELEADQDRAGQGRQLQDRLPPRQESSCHRSRDDEHLEDLLHHRQVGNARGVVLTPAPDRERRLAVELEAEGALGEDTGGMKRIRLEQEDEERGERRSCKTECEPPCRNAPSVGVGEPERPEE